MSQPMYHQIHVEQKDKTYIMVIATINRHIESKGEVEGKMKIECLKTITYQATEVRNKIREREGRKNNSE